MSKSENDSYELGRFGEPSILVLLSLAEGAKHGYAIASDVEAETSIKLGPGTLYGAISRLHEHGFIEACESADRRRPYKITAKGRVALSGYVDTWSRVMTMSKERLV